MYVSRTDVTDLLYSHGEIASEEECDLLNQLVKEVNDLTPMKNLEETHWVRTKNGWMHCEKCGEVFRADNKIAKWVYCPFCGRQVVGLKKEDE